MSAKDELRDLVEELTEREAAQMLPTVKSLRPAPVAPAAADAEDRKRRIREIARRSAARPTLDPRTPDEIIGYDEHGLPT